MMSNVGGKEKTEASTFPSGNGDGDNEHELRLGKEKRKVSTNSVPFYKLFAFADSIDYMLMIAGTLGAIGNGICMPLMNVLMGELIDSFGENQNSKNIVHLVSKVSVKFVYLAIGAGIASFLQVAMWMITRERQSARIRNLYLKTILRQDVSYFDKVGNTGEVVGRMSGDTVLIQDAMGEKVGKFIQLVSLLWEVLWWHSSRDDLLSILLTSLPLLVISSGVTSRTISKMAAPSQDA